MDRMYVPQVIEQRRGHSTQLLHAAIFGVNTLFPHDSNIINSVPTQRSLVPANY